MSDQTGELRPYTVEDMPATLRVSEMLRGMVDRVGKAASWLIIPLILVTCFDVIIRKLTFRGDDGHIVFGVQYWLVNNVSKLFGSTLLQELEWHFHAALFALVLAYGYIYNTHVRVDLVRETLPFRKKVWIEFLGCTVFMIPFCLIVTYFSFIFAYDSWKIGEISASTVGLSNRWVIKSVLVVGLLMAVSAGVAVWLQCYQILWGDPSRRFSLMTLEWPEEEGTMIEGKKRIEVTGDEESFQPATPIPGGAGNEKKNEAS